MAFLQNDVNYQYRLLGAYMLCTCHMGYEALGPREPPRLAQRGLVTRMFVSVSPVYKTDR